MTLAKGIVSITCSGFGSVILIEVHVSKAATKILKVRYFRSTTTHYNFSFNGSKRDKVRVQWKKRIIN